MADAKVIPFDEDTRARRGPGRPRGRAGSRKKSEGAASTTSLSAVPADVPGGADEESDAPETRAPRAGADAASPSGAPREGAQQGQDGRADDSGAAEHSERADGGERTDDGAGPRTAPAAGVAEALTGALTGAAERLMGARWDRKVAHGLSFLRRRITGDYEVDEFGYDEQLTEQVLMSVLRPVFDQYFRVEVKGIENIPAEGGALVVANHSGTLPLDGLMAQVAVHDHHPANRHLRLLAADLVFALPVVNELARKAGHTLACAEDAQLLLERGEVVGVMPEGFKGLGKPFADRYKLQRFGRGGFVSTALRTGAPIVPCSIVGAEEIYPMVGNSRTLARLLGVPYFPVTPTFPWLGPLGLVPLPTKWTIQFGEPIRTDQYPPEAAEDPMLVFNLTDQVRETIQHTLYKLLVQRRSVFF